MADYENPTVVEPPIPIGDMTPIERLLLEHSFEPERDGDAIYFSAWQGPSDYLDLDKAVVANALAASQGAKSQINGRIAELIDECVEDQRITIKLGRADLSCELTLQDIVRRSSTLDHIVITSAFTCSKLRPEGFGGAVTLITADRILGKSTTDVLGELLDEAGIAG